MNTSRIATATLGTCAVLGIGTALAPQASAEEDWTLNYTAKATTTVKKMDQTTTTTGKATSTVTPSTGALSSNLELKDFRAPVKLFGIPLSTAIIRQEAVGPAKGKLNGSTKQVTQSQQVNLRIVSISPFGGGHLNYVGNNCRTAEPTTIKVSGTIKDIFSPVTLKGSYDIPKFSGCGLLTGVINQMVAGKDNPISLELTPV